jgi:hypothetical protein
MRSVPTRCCSVSPGSELVFIGHELGNVRTENGFLGLAVDALSSKLASSAGNDSTPSTPPFILPQPHGRRHEYPPHQPRSVSSTSAAPFSRLGQRSGKHHRDGGTRPNRAGRFNSTGVTPPDRCVPTSQHHPSQPDMAVVWGVGAVALGAIRFVVALLAAPWSVQVRGSAVRCQRLSRDVAHVAVSCVVSHLASSRC